MTQVNAPSTKIGTYDALPCEGPENITIDLRFDLDPAQLVDLSRLQSSGKWSGFETLYIDNSHNPSAVDIFCHVSLQTMTIPPLSFAYMPLIVPNPPKVDFTSTGGAIVRINILNFFLPPVIWSPTTPPGGGGGGGGGIVQVTPVNKSGVTPAVIAANAARKWVIIDNPISAGAILRIDFGGGGIIELGIGAIYETGIAIPLGVINITSAAPGQAFSAYEG